MADKMNDIPAGLRSVSNRRFVGGRGGWGGDGEVNPRKVQVLKEEITAGARKITTRVPWRRPSDGTDVVMVIDVYGTHDEKGLIPNGLIHSLHVMCPKCGPDHPTGAQFEIPAAMVEISFDEKNQLWLGGGRAVIRCPYLCGWVVRIEEGRAHDVRDHGILSKVTY